LLGSAARGVRVFCATLMSHAIERKRAERFFESWMGSDEASHRAVALFASGKDVV